MSGAGVGRDLPQYTPFYTNALSGLHMCTHDKLSDIEIDFVIEICNLKTRSYSGQPYSIGIFRVALLMQNSPSAKC